MKSKLHPLKPILVLLCLTLRINAQELAERKFAIGMQAAPTFTAMRVKSPPYEDDHYRTAMGLIAGISGQFNFCSRVALHTELNYEKRKYIVFPQSPYIDVVDHMTISCFGPLVSKSIITYNSITLPVSLKFSFIQRNRSRVFLNTGTFINYTYNFTRVNYYENGQTDEFRNTYSYKRVNNYDPGALLGVGADVTLYKRIHLTMEVRDHLNLRAVNFTRSNAVGLLTGLTFQL